MGNSTREFQILSEIEQNFQNEVFLKHVLFYHIKYKPFENEATELIEKLEVGRFFLALFNIACWERLLGWAKNFGNKVAIFSIYILNIYRCTVQT